MTTFTKDDFITGDKFLSLQTDDIVYLKVDLIHRGLSTMNWRGKPHNYKPGKVWITGHGAVEINEHLYNKNKGSCKVWFTTNKNYEHENLFAIPLGIGNTCNDSPVHKWCGNVDIMMEKNAKPRTIVNLVYMNFDSKNCAAERRRCYNFFKDKPWVSIGKLEKTPAGRDRFLEDIRSHKFVLCPRGVGIETHRMWETLYMGSIPIVKKEKALNEFRDLPILFIDNWDEISEEFLQKKYDEIISTKWNMEKLKFGYWKKKITNMCNSIKD